MLASFFYAHKHYLLSMDIINNALHKCTNEKIYPGQIGLNQNQENILNLMKQTEICTILKTMGIKFPKFHPSSTIIPLELQLNVHEASFSFHSRIFAYFLSFLCSYHLDNKRSCKQYLLQLRQTIHNPLTTNQSCPYY